MTLAVEGVTYEAEKLFAHLKELAALIGLDGDTELHGKRWDAFGLPDVRTAGGADLGHSDRLLWIDSQCALQEMAEDDPTTATILRARLESAATNASGEWTSWRRFAGAVYGGHTDACRMERYDRGRDRLYAALQGDPGTAVICECEKGGGA